MFIEQPPLLYRLLFPEAIWRINRAGAATVYLTFDDGPIPEVTPQVLDILDAEGVKATFFMWATTCGAIPSCLTKCAAADMP